MMIIACATSHGIEFALMLGGAFLIALICVGIVLSLFNWLADKILGL